MVKNMLRCVSSQLGRGLTLIFADFLRFSVSFALVRVL